MKKIYFSFILMGALTFSSCSMDEAPFGKLDDKTAIQKAEDLRDFRNQLYSNMRTITSGSWLYNSDIQMDEFHGLINNGNQIGQFSTGNFTTSDGDITDAWGGCYNIIAKCNSVIENAAKLAGNTSFGETDQTAFKRYDAEAHFVRAYAYFWLADHFCQSYTQTDPTKDASGLPLVTTYNPSGDIGSYPSRSTLEATFTMIEEDMKIAYDGLKAYEASGASDVATLDAPNAAYLSSYAVEAFQARVALVKGDYPTAAQKAEEVIASGKYELTDIADYAKLWTNDEGTEVIYRPVMTPTELGGSTGSAYISSSETSAYYIPTFAVLSMYAENDVRFGAFFKLYNKLNVEGQDYQAYVLNKFPGNTALRTGTTNNIQNMSKVFRLSEMYLIAAEAEARQGNITPANTYLKAFLAKRLEGYEPNDYSANTILSAILEEREKEFIGEGMRMSDIRRLGKGFSRYADHEDHPELNSIIVKAGQSLSYAADDHRLTWPIPKDEIDANPNIKGQQNPGY